jgi:glycosyltransferase involved in cell wall biosynthesis
MKIGIELRHVTLGSSGGVAQFVQHVLGTLFQLYPKDEFHIFCTIFNRSLISSDLQNVFFHSLPATSFFIELEKLISEKNIEVLFRSFPALDSMKFPMSRQVFSIPDLQHEQFPQFFSKEILEGRRSAFNRVMSRAGAIGTLTQFTQKTILEYPENRCQDIFLLQPALVGENRSQTEVNILPDEEALLPRGNYFYFPANLWPHKNHRRVIEAFQLFLDHTHSDFELILSGHPEGWDILKKEFQALPIRHMGFVRPEIVHFLYQHAIALVFFSLYEGFGMPLLEAFAAGTPVICSNTTSLPEVGGEAILSCDPTNIEDMSNLMVQISQDQDLRAELIRLGKERLRIFSWKQSAKNLREALQRVSLRKVPSSAIEGPLVSIVTPSYNQGCFLRRTIESVLKQTYPKIEYMVMDGESTDESVEILKSYGDRFSWVSEKDNGQTDAINKGFSRSRGEILAYLNSDDVLQPEAVEKVVNFLLDHPEVDLLYGEAYYIDRDDQVTGLYPTREYSFNYLIGEDFICQPAAFWRKRIADRVGSFDESLYIVMDYDYWLRIAKAGGTIVHLNDILASSRAYPETKTLSAREKVYSEIMRISKKHIGYVHHNYFLGLWNYRVWERGGGIYGLMRHMRGSLKISALFHNLYANRHYYYHSIKPRSVRQQASHLLKSNAGILRPLMRKFRTLRYVVNPNKPVFGLWKDNWLGPIAQVYLKRKNPGQKFYMVGSAGANMSLKVKIESQSVLTIFLKEKELTRVEIDASTGQKILLEFSKSIRDSAGRYKTFLITDTNLFAEHDLAYAE